MSNEFIPNISVQADGRENIYLQNELSEPQKAELNEQHMLNAIEVERLNDRIAELNTEKRVFAKKNHEILLQARLGYSEENIDAFYIDNFDDGTRQYYNTSGFFVHERNLKPSEIQQNKLKFVQNS